MFKIIFFFIIFLHVSPVIADESVQVWDEIIKESKTVVLGSYHVVNKEQKTFEFRVKYGWGEEVVTKFKGDGHSTYIVPEEDVLIFFGNSPGYFLNKIYEIEYSKATVPYKLLGSPEWAVTEDGEISHY
jgi:hypothetical protein